MYRNCFQKCIIWLHIVKLFVHFEFVSVTSNIQDLAQDEEYFGFMSVFIHILFYFFGGEEDTVYLQNLKYGNINF